MKDKVMKAARRYLSIQGYDILGSTDDFIVCDTEDGMVFCHVIYRTDGSKYPESKLNDLRTKFEQVMFEWFKDRNHDDMVDLSVSCDEIQMLILNPDRALIRHYVNAVGVA